MGYAQRLVTRILADEQARGNAAATQRVYRDEPILRTGADLLRERAAAQRAQGSARNPEQGGSAGSPSRRRPAAQSAARRARRPGGAPQRPLPFGQTGPFAESAIPRPERTCELPPLLQELRTLQRDLDARLVPEGKAFVQQALLAASYEDDYAYDGCFQHYFPTYRHMTDAQLRGYFAWRTRVRRGEVRATSLSFAFVHLYELVNGIGPAGAMEPREGYAALQGFCRAYGEIDARILRHARAWCRDYAVYHGLDAALSPGEEASEEALRTLREADGADGADDAALFDALARLSSYRIERSRLMRDHGPLLKAAACRSWRALSAYYRAHRKSTLSEHLFGTIAARPYAMFGAAVFWQERRPPDCRRKVGPLTRFICEDGRWLREGPYRPPAPSREAGALLKAVDAALRERLGDEHPLKGAAVPKYAQRIIDRQVEDLLAQERQRREQEAEALRRRVSIDFSKLASIRAEAAASCEALLTEEERERPDGVLPKAQAHDGQRTTSEERAEGGAPASRGTAPSDAIEAASDPSPAPAPAPSDEARANRKPPCPAAVPTAPSAQPAASLDDTPAPSPAPLPTTGVPAGSPSPLSEAEEGYLLCLLEDGSPEEGRAALERAGVSAALMMDAINEKLFDALGDVALVEDDGVPQLLEDYREDVRRIIAA